MYRLMRRATSLIHTSDIKILLNLPSVIVVLIFVNVKILIMLMLFLEKSRGHHVGDPCSRISIEKCSFYLSCQFNAKSGAIKQLTRGDQPVDRDRPMLVPLA